MPIREFECPAGHRHEIIDLRVPSVAAYYGIVLMATGDKAKAREFLELGQKATLLPEERTLLARALATVGAQ